jgi:hypothetical protein
LLFVFKKSIFAEWSFLAIFLLVNPQQREASPKHGGGALAVNKNP